MISRSFWNGRRVLLTGHTGFKGSWLVKWLEHLNAEVFGFALEPETDPNLFDTLKPFPNLTSVIGDLRDSAALARVVKQAKPSVVIHMGAQALVRRSYRNPRETFDVNVTGTMNVLEALRANEHAKGDLAAVLVVTTDKVYLNSGTGNAFREGDPLGGHDPYSASKAAAEMVTHSWAKSFFAASGTPVATARAGNVVGGGDWSVDRLVPDLWRAAHARATVTLRNPSATRPWQFVLDPLAGYLSYIETLAGSRGTDVPTAMNFGPEASDILTVAEASKIFLSSLGNPCEWRLTEGAQPHEAALLTLDATLAERTLGWTSKLNAREALRWTAEWYEAWSRGENMRRLTSEQIERYEAIR